MIHVQTPAGALYFFVVYFNTIENIVIKVLTLPEHIHMEKVKLFWKDLQKVNDADSNNRTMKCNSRYIMRGLIDGALSTLGVIIGASSANPAIIITAGLGGGVANGLSNILGAFTAEKARIEQEISELEKAMLKDGTLRETTIYEEAKKLTIVGGLSDGLSTIVGSIIPVSPFILMYIFGYTREMAMVFSIVATIFLLFFLGIYIGRLSKENIAVAGIKMAVIGLVTAIVCTIVEKSFRIILS